MKHLIRRCAAAGLALALTITAASASYALGWDLHTGQVPLSQGATLGKNIFWSDTYSDLRHEYYISYSPNTNVVPTVAYGTKVLNRLSLSSMAKTLESQGKRVVSGINGDWYVLSTGSTVGLLVTDGVVRATPYYNNAWAVGFNKDGTAFIGQPTLSTTVSFGGQLYKLSGAINKVRKVTASDTSGGLTLLTSDFATTTQNTAPGVDVILAPVNDGVNPTVPTIGKQVQYKVEQVLESTGSIAIPEGKAVLTMNGKDNADILAKLRALVPGDTVTLSITSPDARWNSVDQAIGGTYKIVTGGQVNSGLPSERTAWTAVGVKADGSTVFYTIDGKQSGYSVGCTLNQVAQRLIELGCVDAVAMDGGGSTTIGVTYPETDGMQVINRPSDGSQRANSTAIFLTTTLQPTGQLGSYYVTPTDSMLLAGASVQLTASGLDTSYYPTTGNLVSWTVSDGGGTVDQNGWFTAGTQSGFSQVTASDGMASGTAYLTTVGTPDTLTVTNEATGAKVSSINLDPGQQINLKGSATYRTLPLTAQDTCFTWSLSPASLGTVDANGVFTAGSSSGSGTLTVSVGGKSVSIPVTIAGHINLLNSCENTLSAFTGTATASVAPETSIDYVHNGKQSLKLSYNASSGTASLSTALSIPSGESWVGMWVYGDGSGNTLMATALDASNLAQQFKLTTLDFTGWNYVMAQLPAGAASLTSLDVVYGGAGRQSGTIWLDQLVTANQNLSDSTAPTVSVTVKGNQLTATVQDNLNTSFAQEQVKLTYDGTPLTGT